MSSRRLYAAVLLQVAVVGCAVSPGEVPPPSATPTFKALPVDSATTSSASGHEASMFDQDLYTRWEPRFSDRAPSITLKLERPSKVTGVSMVAVGHIDMPDWSTVQIDQLRLQVEASSDGGQTWAVVANDMALAALDERVIPIPEVVADQLRLTVQPRADAAPARSWSPALHEEVLRDHQGSLPSLRHISQASSSQVVVSGGGTIRPSGQWVSFSFNAAITSMTPSGNEYPATGYFSMNVSPATGPYQRLYGTITGIIPLGNNTYDLIVQTPTNQIHSFTVQDNGFGYPPDTFDGHPLRSGDIRERFALEPVGCFNVLEVGAFTQP